MRQHCVTPWNKLSSSRTLHHNDLRGSDRINWPWLVFNILNPYVNWQNIKINSNYFQLVDKIIGILLKKTKHQDSSDPRCISPINRNTELLFWLSQLVSLAKMANAWHDKRFLLVSAKISQLSMTTSGHLLPASEVIYVLIWLAQMYENRY